MAKSWKKNRRIRPKRFFKNCQFCKEKKEPNYKDIEILNKYIYESGKITSRKINANCAKHQRRLAKAVKRARFLAMLPFIKRIRRP